MGATGVRSPDDVEDSARNCGEVGIADDVEGTGDR